MKLLLYYVHIRLVTKELELFNSDPTLPIYSHNTTGYDVMELTKISLKDPLAQKYICTSYTAYTVLSIKILLSITDTAA